MRKILEACPTCGGEMDITRLTCRNCETVVLARYAPCTFCRLSPESLRFVEVFVKNRGNLKEMERELGKSYWGLRSQLDDIIRELGYETAAAEEQEAEDQRRAVLEQLDRGELTATQAAERLAALSRSGAK